MKKIVLINSHPKKDSFCTALAEQYIAGAEKSNHQIKIVNLRDLDLETFIKYEYQNPAKLNADLIEAQNLITWANHLVFVYPIWWNSSPALLKVFLEIIFESGFAFQYQKSTGIVPKWDKLLANKSARVLTTMDSPPWYFTWFKGDPAFKMMKHSLTFCGITPVRKNYFGVIKTSSEAQRKKWLEQAYKIGLKE